MLFEAVFGAAVEDVLHATAIHSNNGPHAMIVGFKLHLRYPTQVEEVKLTIGIQLSRLAILLIGASRFTGSLLL